MDINTARQAYALARTLEVLHCNRDNLSVHYHSIKIEILKATSTEAYKPTITTADWKTIDTLPHYVELIGASDQHLIELIKNINERLKFVVLNEIMKIITELKAQLEEL